MHLSPRAFALAALAALAAIAGLWVDAVLLRPAAGLALLLLIGLAVEARAKRRARPAFSLRPGRLTIGRPSPFGLALANPGRRPLTIEYVAPRIGGGEAEDGVTRVAVAPDATCETAHRLTPTRLGPAGVDPLRARTLGLFGLAWWGHLVDVAGVIAVGPDAGGRTLHREGLSEQGRGAERLAAHGAEFVDLREWRDGDSPRAIDWVATARRGRPIVREYAEDMHLEVLMMIDAGRRARLESEGVPRLSRYAGVAARFARAAAARDDRVGLVAYAERTLARCRPAGGAAGVRGVVTALERLEASDAESDPVAAALDARPLLRARGLVCILTEFDGAADGAALARAIQLLRPKHAVLVAALASRRLTALARARPASRRDAWLGFAAEEHAAAQARDAARLRLAGVPVVVAPPDSFERAVLDAYVSLRRRRRV
jgi:uncharacterized protein (DUF58 family)